MLFDLRGPLTTRSGLFKPTVFLRENCGPAALTGSKTRSHTLVSGQSLSGLGGERLVGLRPTVAEELPGLPYLRNHVEIEIRDQNLVLIAARLRDDLAARIAEVALAVELADVPGLLGAYAINCAHEISVRHRVRRLLQLPQIFRESGNRGGRIKDDLRAVQTKDARAFRKMTVIANINSDRSMLGFENGIAQIARREVELLPESGMHVRDVVLAVLAQIASIRINDRSRIEIHSRHLLFVNRNYDYHLIFGCDLLH